LAAAWTSPLRPVESPVAVVGGFVFHALSDQRRFEVVSVAARDGHVRWRAPASPSRLDHGVGLSVESFQGGRTVLWMQPGRVYRAGDVSLVGADAATGARRWSYGGGRLRVRSAPSICRGGTAVCLVAYLSGPQSPRSVVLEASSGRVLSDRPAPFTGEVRSIADGLYEAKGVLARVDESGTVVWNRTVKEAFGGEDVDSDYGWNIRLADGRYVGSLGRVRSSMETGATRIKIQDLAVTAAIDAGSGRTLWTRPRSSVFCGQLQFDVAHAVLCDSTGLTNPDASEVTGLDVTLDGVDPATGRNTWQAHVGAVRGLLKNGDDVIRTAATTYTLRTASGLGRLDLASGFQQGDAEDTGWCSANDSVRPAENVEGVNPNGVDAYAVDRWYPCRIGGASLDRPKQTATFAGGTADGIFAYVTRDGTLRAVSP
jgi:PQQ-like domain